MPGGVCLAAGFHILFCMTRLVLVVDIWLFFLHQLANQLDRWLAQSRHQHRARVAGVLKGSKDGDACLGLEGSQRQMQPSQYIKSFSTH